MLKRNPVPPHQIERKGEEESAFGRNYVKKTSNRAAADPGQSSEMRQTGSRTGSHLYRFTPIKERVDRELLPEYEDEEMMDTDQDFEELEPVSTCKL